VTSEHLAAAGAFLSGAGSVLGCLYAIRAMRRRMEKECAERIRLLKEGITIGERHDP
jgi:hypothetical protein